MLIMARAATERELPEEVETRLFSLHRLSIKTTQAREKIF
jgi:hypothetical protein